MKPKIEAKVIKFKGAYHVIFRERGWRFLFFHKAPGHWLTYKKTYRSKKAAWEDCGAILWKTPQDVYEAIIYARTHNPE